MLPPLAPRRLLGEVPVAADGSFQVQVPANTPIELQLVDQNGLSLRSCGWIWTRNHFNQGCVGCHEDPELAPENALVEALEGPAPLACPPELQRPSIDFRRDVMPTVVGKCLPCHRPGGSPPDLTCGQPIPPIRPIPPGPAGSTSCCWSRPQATPRGRHAAGTSTRAKPAPVAWCGTCLAGIWPARGTGRPPRKRPWRFPPIRQYRSVRRRE